MTRLKRGSAANGAYSSPTSKREKRAMRTFSPVFAAMSVRSSSIVLRLVLLRVEVLLLEQRALAGPLLELALDDLLDHVVGLAVGLRLLGQDLALALALLLGDVLEARRAGGSSR